MRLRTRLHFLVLSLALAALLLLLSAPRLSAARQEPAGPEEALAVTADDGTREIGVEWITDWPGTADDRANWYHSAVRLYNEVLDDGGWVGRFNYGNTNAWERDFKHATYGGINDSIIDAVDIAMIGTHGSSAWDTTQTPDRVLSSVYFSSDNDDWHLSPGEAKSAYGNNDLEWLAFDSCSVLRDDSMWYWYQTFDGLHLMLGFANTMYVVYPGDGGVWGDQMREEGWWIFGHGAKTVTQAWFTAVEDQQPSGVRARVLAETLDSYNDYLHGEGYVSPDYANNGAYWYWDHVAGTPPPIQLPPGPAPTQLPAVQVGERTVDEAYVQDIGAAFGLTGEVLKGPDGNWYMAGGPDDSLQLRVDGMSGGFFFQDLGNLWTDPERPRLLLPASGRDAQVAAIQFLNEHDNLPGQFDRQIYPTVELEGPAEGMTEPDAPGALGASAVITPTNYAVHYARTLNTGAMDLSIVGPGSRMNVYVGEDDAIIGLKGGARNFDVVYTDTIPILTADDAWDKFLADPTIALADIPAPVDVYERAGKPAPTLGYYEQPSALGQSEFIPVWIFVADLLVDVPEVVITGAQAPSVLAPIATDAYIYVPAAAEDTPLEATIAAPADGFDLPFGETVDLSGSAGGGAPPYSYEWSSSVDGFLGAGATLDDVALTADLRGGTVEPNIVTLTVIDANSLIATDTVAIDVPGTLFLPTLHRD